MRLSVRGTYRPQGGRSSFVVKSHEILEEEEGDSVHTEGIVPVYPASEQVSARLLRGLLREARPEMRRLPDPLPAALRAREGLPTRADATVAVHLPRDLEEARAARARLVLEELLLMQVGLLLHKGEQQRRAAAPALAPPDTRAGRSLRACRSSSPPISSRRSTSWTPISRARSRCAACCRATWARARRS